MNGVHDMGGMHGMGPVMPEPNEPVFHQDWERRVFALTIACGFNRWNIDQARYSRERMPPAAYLAASYYEKWLWGMERLLLEAGHINAEELKTGIVSQSPSEPQALDPAAMTQLLRNRRGARMDDTLTSPRFKSGERVRTKNFHPVGHTRLPRYARDKFGTINRDHGVFVFPDKHAQRREKVPQHCYHVRFEGHELWGSSSGPRDAVYVDLFESYLEPA